MLALISLCLALVMVIKAAEPIPSSRSVIDYGNFTFEPIPGTRLVPHDGRFYLVEAADDEDDTRVLARIADGHVIAVIQQSGVPAGNTAPTEVVVPPAKVYSLIAQLRTKCEVSPDIDMLAVLDRLEIVLARDVGNALSFPVALKWLQTGVAMSHSAEPDLWPLSRELTYFGMFQFVSLRGVPPADLAKFFDETIRFAFPANIVRYLPLVAAKMTRRACGFCNERNELPVIAALRIIPENEIIPPGLLKRTPSKHYREVVQQLPTVLDRMGDVRWARFAWPVIEDHLRGHNWDMRAIWDTVDGDGALSSELKCRIEDAIRLRHLIERFGLITSFLDLFDARTLHLSPQEAFIKLTDGYTLKFSGGEDDMILDTLAWIKSEEVGPPDLLGHGQFPDDNIVYLNSLVNAHLVGSKEAVVGSRALKYILHLSDLTDFGKLRQPELTDVTIAYILSVIIPELDVTCPDVYDRILCIAMRAGPARFRINLLRIALYLGRVHHHNEELMRVWMAAFTRPDICAIRDVFPHLLTTAQWIIKQPEYMNFAAPVVRAVAAFISHLDVRRDICDLERFPQPIEATLTFEFLQSLNADLRTRIYLAVDDDRDFDALFRLHELPNANEYLTSYLISNYSDCIRKVTLTAASEQDVTGLSDACSICLSEHYVAEAAPPDVNPQDYTARTPCGHYFHANCVMNWICSNHGCPICRSALLDSRDIVAYIRRHHS